MPAICHITKPATSLGQRISAARKDAALTQQQLADKLGTTQRVVTYWEREAVSLKAEQLTALAVALGITLDKLMGRPQPKARGTGPTGRAKHIFDRVTARPASSNTASSTPSRPSWSAKPPSKAKRPQAAKRENSEAATKQPFSMTWQRRSFLCPASRWAHPADKPVPDRSHRKTSVRSATSAAQCASA